MVSNFEFGISIYLSNGIEKNSKYLENAKKFNSSFAFTTINMPEENDDLKKDINDTVELCKNLGIKLIVDINKKSQKYIKNYENVYYRIDDGLTNDEIIELAKKYFVVLNSTTLGESDLEYFKNKRVDFSRLYSLHNYYPKVYTGVSLEFAKKRNELYKKYGLKTMAFIPGDVKREPLYKGLPTVEKHRNIDIIQSILELLSIDTDVIMLGDIDLSKDNWERLNYLFNGIVPIRIDRDILQNKVFENRRDYSSFVVRDTKRNTFLDIKPIKSKISRGDILVTDSTGGRYFGDLEIALKDLENMNDGRCVVASVKDYDIPLLDYLSIVRKYVFIYSNL